jgi:hypothetical protein
MTDLNELDWTMRDGLPEAVWSAARLGDHGTYGLLMDLRFVGRMDFWIVALMKDSDPEHPGGDKPCYRALRTIDSCKRTTDGAGNDSYIAPECWTTAGREKVKMLTYPLDTWSEYDVIGMPDE